MMVEDIYRKLQQYLDTMSVGFPPTDSGIEIRILKRLFSEKDAELFLALTPRPRTPEEIAAALGRDPDELAGQLRDMANRGLIYSMTLDGVTKYLTIAYVHGIYEFQLTRMDKELAQMFTAYFDEAFGKAMLFSASYFLRTIPVEEAIPAGHAIAAFEDAEQILRSQKLISVSECICRKELREQGQGCDKPLEVCFMFGNMAEFYLDNGMARRIDADEAVRLLRVAQQAGLVTQPSTSQNPGGMCNCCGDCCCTLRALNLSDKPAEHAMSNHQAVLDPAVCTGCEICIDRCPMHALTMKENVAALNPDRCIGCGLCAAACPSGALQIIRKEIQIPIPVGVREQMQQMARNRGLLK